MYEMINQLVFASHNRGKYKEMSYLMADLGIELVFLGDHSDIDIEETGLSFHENALLKARQASQLTGLPALGDDSGLCVKALNNEPGIYSARYNGASSSFESKMLKLLATLKNQHERDAFFVCVLAFVKNDLDPLPRFYEGFWHGQIANEIKGEHGFGYDPIFIPIKEKITFGQMPKSKKIKMDHRYLAFKKLKRKIKI